MHKFEIRGDLKVADEIRLSNSCGWAAFFVLFGGICPKKCYLCQLIEKIFNPKRI